MVWERKQYGSSAGPWSVVGGVTWCSGGKTRDSYRQGIRCHVVVGEPHQSSNRSNDDYTDYADFADCHIRVIRVIRVIVVQPVQATTARMAQPTLGVQTD